MANQSRNKKNEPPTGQGKKQSPEAGAPGKLGKRSEVVQSQRGRPDLNLGTDADEDAARPLDPEELDNPDRGKAGR